MRPLLARIGAFRQWHRELSPLRGSLVSIGIFVAVIAMAVGAAAGFQAWGGESRAKDACEESVANRLRAPSSAEFVRSIATEGEDGVWTVSGTVDAQNGFGAMIRSFYTCKVENEELGWYAYSVEIEDGS